jgi:hypothetical protein
VLWPTAAGFGTDLGSCAWGILHGAYRFWPLLLLLLLCSEWETRSLYAYMQRELTGTTRGLFMDIHSGMWALMSPW